MRNRQPVAQTAEFDRTFDALADVTAAVLDRLGIRQYAVHVQDYGASVGRRLMLYDPGRITPLQAPPRSSATRLTPRSTS